MSLIEKIKAFLKRIWRFWYHSVLEVLRRITPERVKKIILKILYRRERKIIVQNQEILRHILKEKHSGKDYRTIIVFPPSLDWDVQLFQRPQQLALPQERRGTD